MKEIILHNPNKGKKKAGFIDKQGIVYEVANPTCIDQKSVHFGYIGINEYNRDNGIKSQVVNFGRIGGYLIPIK